MGLQDIAARLERIEQRLDLIVEGGLVAEDERPTTSDKD
jgi:hypothetical protein